jgi:uncharacterized membrane protein required for colicin V production
VWLDALAVLVLGIFIGVGALRGARASGLAVAGLLAGYAAAFWAAPRLGPALARDLGMAGLAGAALAGSAAFAAGWLAVRTAGALALRRPLGGGARDRALGGAFGALRGGLVVLLLAWLALWADALRSAVGAPGLPDASASRVAAATSAVVEAGVGAALADAGPLGRVAARAAARPAASLASLRSALESPRTQALQGDRLFWTWVENGSVESALGRPSCQALVHDPELRAELARLGVVEPAAAADPSAFRSALAEALRELGPRLRDLRRDPALGELLADQEVVARARSGDALGLLGNERFRALVARAAAQPAPD